MGPRLLEATEIHFATEIYYSVRRPREMVLFVTFPEEFRHMTNPPLSDSMIRLTYDDDAETAIINMEIDFRDRNLGVPSQQAIDFIEEHGHVDNDGVWGNADLEYEYYSVFLHIADGVLKLYMRVDLAKVTEANAPKYIKDAFNRVVWEYGDQNDLTGYQRLVNEYFVPDEMELQRREGAGLGLQMSIGLFVHFAQPQPLVLTDYVPGQRIYTFQSSEFVGFPSVLSDEAFANFINANAPGPPLLNVTFDDGVLSIEWNRCSIKIYQEEKVVEVILFGNPRDGFPLFPRFSTLDVDAALEVADAWFIETHPYEVPPELGKQCRYTKYREQYELRQRTDDGEVRLKGGCINKEDPITSEDFEEDLNHPMVFQTTSGHCFKGTHTPQTLGQLNHRNPYNREILSSNCFEKVEREERPVFMRMSLMGLQE